MTVGLVIVSHSAQLARGVVQLAGQMTQGKTPIVAAGGAGGDILGTSVDIILEALQTIDAPDGILILMDMGSALLSTEMALEFLDDERRSRVSMSAAPLVEGAVAAALEAAAGHTLAQVKAAADNIAQLEQLQHLKPIPQSSEQFLPTEKAVTPTPAPPSSQSQAHSITLTLTNPAGLHARPASLFVQTAASFQSELHVQGRGRQVDATSIIGILSLGARQSDTITITAIGTDAEQALAALSELIRANFHEAPPIGDAVDAPTPLPPPTIVQEHHTIWHGVTTSAGAALGPAYLYTSQAVPLNAIERRTIDPHEVVAEQARLQEALTTTAKELESLAQQLQQQIGSADAAIFEAQALMLDDPLMLGEALHRIANQFLDAASALAETGEQHAASLQALDNPLLAARATDIRDAVSRAISHLRDSTNTSPDLSTLPQPVILVAQDLTPSDTATLRPDIILGICTVQGGPTAHAAILARALGIPAMAGLDKAALQHITAGTLLGLDADNGLLYTQLPPAIEQALRQRILEQQQQRAALQAAAQQEYTPLIIGTQHISLLANIGSASEAEVARQWGAEGIGLLRTEFLFAATSSQTMPSIEEQRQRYVQVFQAFRGENAPDGPITVRTLDAGADKPMTALQTVTGPISEANPALGVRGIRIHLAHQQLLEEQITALLLAATDTDVALHIMFPMITTFEELQTVRTLYTRVYTDLQQQQKAVLTNVRIGIMVEVPAAAVMAPELAELADFFSIGANDLLQYTLAADRTNAALATLYNPLQPSVLRLIAQIAQAGQRAGKPVAVCGEMAGDTRLAPVLVGFGVTELSMAPTALPAIRKVLTGKTPEVLSQLAKRILTLKTIAEVETACSEFQQSPNR